MILRSYGSGQVTQPTTPRSKHVSVRSCRAFAANEALWADAEFLKAAFRCQLVRRHWPATICSFSYREFVRRCFFRSSLRSDTYGKK